MSQSTSLTIAKIVGPARSTGPDCVAVEEPLEIRVAHRSLPGTQARSISITMRTPGDDIDLAHGFLYGEGIINSARDVIASGYCGPAAPDSGNHNIVRVDLSDKATLDLDRLQRHFYTTSSCGVCGKSSLDALSMRGERSLTEIAMRYSADMIKTLPAALRASQQVFDQTGGIHAAALFDADGVLSVVREDVGRHNAVDKVVGRLLTDNRLPAHEHGLLVSGRASFELMQKCLRAGIPLLAAVGAPSSLAVSVAQEFGMTLVGFLSEVRFNIYNGPERIV